MYTNKQIQILLKNAVYRSTVKEEVLGKCNGFDIITHYKDVVDGEHLKKSIETLIDTLSISEGEV